jgi:hypothetical protein
LELIVVSSQVVSNVNLNYVIPAGIQSLSVFSWKGSRAALSKEEAECLIERNSTLQSVHVGKECIATRHIVWQCSNAIKSDEVRKVVAFTKEVSALIESQKKGGCFSTSYTLRSKTSKCLVALDLIKNMLGLANPCARKKEIAKAAFAARLLCQLAAWNYNSTPEAVDSLKQVAPWKDTPYARAQDMFAKARADLFANKEGHAPRQCTITTPDGAALSGIYFPGTQKKVILLAIGLTAMYEECIIDFVYDKFITFFKKECEDLNVLIVNTRGIGLSEGATSPSSMQVDVFSAYQFLIQRQGFDPEDVLVYGHSLGGCYGLQGAALIQQEYPNKRISAIVDRSFLSLSTLVKERSGALAKRAIQTSGLEMDCQKAAETLKGRVVTIVSENDETVPYLASFAVQVVPKKIDLKIIKIAADPKVTNHHIRKFSDEEARQVSSEIRAIFAKKSS